MKALRSLLVIMFTFGVQPAIAQETLKMMEDLATSDPKPFVIVEGSGETTKGRGQGVVISNRGHVLSAAHIAWLGGDDSFTDQFRISFRGTGKDLPAGIIHTHKVSFKDREGEPFFERYYRATMLRENGSRFIDGGDLAVFRIEAKGEFPKVDFFSKTKPAVAIGDIFHLCHFSFPLRAGDPFFLMNPVEVVGIAQTSSGLQYLAKGYYRIGSSGGAILKNGRLIGIQSSAYTVNATDVGEIPLGLISFELVWSDLFDELLADEEAKPTSTEN